MNTQRLIKYLEAINSKDPDCWGWQGIYEKSLCTNSDISYAWLTGHYSGLVDDVVNLIGRDRLLRLACAMDDIEEMEQQRRTFYKVRRCG